MRKTQNEKTDFAKYGQDALEAWNHYEETQEVDQLADVLRDRLKKMDPRLVEQFYIFGLVYADTNRNSR